MVEDLTPGKVDFEETRRREDDTNSLPLLADFLSWHECRACDCCGKYFQGRVTRWMPRHPQTGAGIARTAIVGDQLWNFTSCWLAA